MVLPRNVYRALESIVGPENITEDPAILVGYAYQWTVALIDPSRSRLMPFMPEAVVLPENTEEVSAIVKICNRYKVRFKAFSTGWGPWASPGMSNVIILDLRRMNRIVKIDEKNMYAIVEPYVTARQLEAEAEKVGLTASCTGAGSSHSVLASCTSGWGYGMKGAWVSHNNRNLLAVEWVLPSGEIVRLGSAGSGAGWFTGDGPGPSLRGLFRGWTGGMGGTGVFTKCAVKLYPWPGPSKPKIVGEHPQIGLDLPENFKLYIPYWRNWDDLADAFYKINEYEIGMVVWRNAPLHLAILLSKNNNETVKHFHKLLEKYRFHLEVVLAGYSMRELEYQEKVLKDIVSETHGDFIPLDEEPFKNQIPVLYMYLIANPYTPRIFRPAGDFATSFGSAESWDTSIRGAKIGEEVKRKWEEEGTLLQEIEGFWGGPYERKFTHFEGVFGFDPTDPESRKAAYQYAEKALAAVVENKLGIPILLIAKLHDMVGPMFSNYHIWIKKIKKIIDPNNVADHSFYVEPEGER